MLVITEIIFTKDIYEIIDIVWKYVYYRTLIVRGCPETSK
ncbi:hypothetical protein N500_0961, partial [Wolbachia pipientis wUni]